MTNAILHKAKGAIAERQSLTESLVGRHAAGALDLLACTAIHAVIITQRETANAMLIGGYQEVLR